MEKARSSTTVASTDGEVEQAQPARMGNARQILNRMGTALRHQVECSEAEQGSLRRAFL